MSKVALVVGGGRNLGAFLCNGLAAAGYKIAVADLDGQSAQETAAAIAEQFGAENVMAVQANSTAVMPPDARSPVVGAVHARSLGRARLVCWIATCGNALLNEVREA